MKKEWLEEHKTEVLIYGLAIMSMSAGLIVGGKLVNDKYNLIFDIVANHDRGMAFMHKKTGKTVFILTEECLRDMAK